MTSDFIGSAPLDIRYCCLTSGKGRQTRPHALMLIVLRILTLSSRTYTPKPRGKIPSTIRSYHRPFLPARTSNPASLV